MLATLILAHLILADAAARPSAWILTCDLRQPRSAARAASDGAAAAPRVFRLAPGRLQEWSASRKEFGPNLCDNFQCRADRGRLEGSVQSASVIFTLTFDPPTRTASWRTLGASGQGKTTGSCAVKAAAGA